uniref:GST N-terminal domain-containing protein n=1 Tax=Panagrolaimus davidi TaxID=227884 RepID=A0A914PFV5_9BILA
MNVVVCDTHLTWSTMSVPTSSTSSLNANGIPITVPFGQIPSGPVSGPSTNSTAVPSSNGISVITKNDQKPEPTFVYKLVYFTSRGYAEVSRLILHYSQIPFQDMRLNVNEWAYFKSRKFQVLAIFLSFNLLKQI